MAEKVACVVECGSSSAAFMTIIQVRYMKFFWISSEANPRKAPDYRRSPKRWRSFEPFQAPEKSPNRFCLLYATRIDDHSHDLDRLRGRCSECRATFFPQKQTHRFTDRMVSAKLRG